MQERSTTQSFQPKGMSQKENWCLQASNLNLETAATEWIFTIRTQLIDLDAEMDRLCSVCRVEESHVVCW